MSNSKYSVVQGYQYIGDDLWDWWVAIDGAENDLNEIQKVIYTLHPTFIKPIVTVNERITNFKLKASGWGTFRIYIKIVLSSGDEIKLQHDLELYYPDDEEGIRKPA